MELKPYQQQVLKDLADFLEFVRQYKKLDVAFEKFWNDKGALVGGEDGLPPYKNTVPSVPHACVKVPTGGGKTFIACNSLRTIFEALPEGKAKAVVWLVPSNTILEQTLINLRNSYHPYREKIDSNFNGRVVIYEKEELLQAAGFNPTSVREQLSIFVLSYDSIRSNRKDGRKIYQSNGYLDGFIPTYSNPETLLPQIDESALIQVINQLNPVCIVDESHNAESDLSVEMLRNLNPCFILDLTATPRQNSNIISYVSAVQLKKEHMVKLPVVVYNHNNVTDVFNDALNLQQKLEARAIAASKLGGEYIRPIVLFQAQPRTNDDNTTFEKIKHRLIHDFGVNPAHIAIKTAEINELKPWNLLDRECPIRYIITVNALKEGWDCSFAYILASLANKASAVDVEQILGRILRQPNAKMSSDEMLNVSYVFTASDKFLDTLENIVLALNKAGFSRRDCRLAEPSQFEETPIPAPQIPLVPSSETQNEEQVGEELVLEPERITFNPQANLEHNSSDTNDPVLVTLESQALAAAGQYQQVVEDEKSNQGLSQELGNAMKRYSLREVNRSVAGQVFWPEFYIAPLFASSNAGGLFDIASEDHPVNKEYLLKGFNLANADSNISFAATEPALYLVDANDDFVPRYEKAAPRIREEILRYISSQPEEVQIKNLADLIFENLRRMDVLPDSEIKKYIGRIIESLTAEQREDLKQNPFRYAEAIKLKINTLMTEYAETAFYRQLDTDRIVIHAKRTFPKSINLTDTVVGIKNMLYEVESQGDGFERKVINEVANLDNVLFWHKNVERRGFAINGGFLNHYPDFIVLTKRGKLIVIETKGDDRDNSDSRAKLKLGQAWANKSGSDKFKYFMVFDNNPLDGAYGLADFLKVMKEL